MIDSVYDGYRAVLAKEAELSPEDWTFKSNPVYRQILEHVSLEQGAAYLLLAMSHPRWDDKMRLSVAATAMENDRLGCPNREAFDELGIFCSPTNMRYLWHAMRIWDHVDSLNLHEPDFIEIGGGYGGLALWLDRLYPQRHFTHTILDVPEAVEIQGLYMRELAVQATPTESIEDMVLQFRLHRNPFLISAYGFSEFTQEIRDSYQREVVSKCEHGWLLWNNPSLYEFTDKPMTIQPERPLTGKFNCEITF